MDKKFELTTKDILDKEFHIDLKGYSANEVDSFLDLIIADYQTYEESIKGLGESLYRFEMENNSLKQRIRDLENQLQSKNEAASGNSDNIDVLKRLSRLEQAVFNGK